MANTTNFSSLSHSIHKMLPSTQILVTQLFRCFVPRHEIFRRTARSSALAYFPIENARTHTHPRAPIAGLALSSLATRNVLCNPCSDEYIRQQRENAHIPPIYLDTAQHTTAVKFHVNARACMRVSALLLDTRKTFRACVVVRTRVHMAVV